MKSYDYHRQAKIDKAIDKTGGVYPGGNGEDYLHSGLPGVGYIASRWARATSAEFVCTRAEFESRKAERQGKPSWDDAPKWARYLAQDSGGRWYWYDAKPVAFDEEFGVEAEVGKAYYSSRYGEVIGDWRSTPEQRPNHIGESCEKAAKAAKFISDVAVVSPYLAVRYARRLLPDLFDNSPSLGESADWYDYDNLIATGYPKPSEIVQAFYGQNDGTGRWVECFVTGLSEHGDLVLETRGSPPGFDKWFTVDCKSKYRPLDFNKVAKHPWHEQGSEPSPELSFHLSNAFNELQASARLLPEDDPLRASIVSLAGGVSAVKEVA